MGWDGAEKGGEVMTSDVMAAWQSVLDHRQDEWHGQSIRACSGNAGCNGDRIG